MRNFLAFVFITKSAAYSCCSHRHINAHVGNSVDLKAGAAIAVVICCHRCLVFLAFENVPLRRTEYTIVPRFLRARVS